MRSAPALVVVLAWLVGCFQPPEFPRREAAELLACPEEQLEIGGGGPDHDRYVRGCGHVVRYQLVGNDQKGYRWVLTDKKGRWVGHFLPRKAIRR